MDVSVNIHTFNSRAILIMTINQYMGKYVISPIDGLEYCRKNGQFLKHIRSHGYTYQSLFEHFNPPEATEYCRCGSKCNFVNATMSYRQTCGNKECASAITSDIRNSRTPEEWDAWKQKHQLALANKTPEELQNDINKRRATAIANGSYEAAVDKRNATREALYGDPLYNNSEQISATKLAWDKSRVELFKLRLKDAMGGKSLNDFHTREMFIARRKMMEERGDIIPLDRLSEWQQYNKEVRNATERVYRAHKQEINPNNYPRSSSENGMALSGILDVYQLDHIVSVHYGFQNNIPAELIASKENLQMLPWRENNSKGRKYDVSSGKLEQLIEQHAEKGPQ